MPAEWEKHEATWMSWPSREGISFPGSYDLVPPVLARMVEALAESEVVRINVRDAAQEKEVRRILRRVPQDRVEYVHIPTNEPWCRDHGPIFLTGPGPGGQERLAVLDWEYNAWGFKYPPFDQDNAVPVRVAATLGLPVYSTGVVLEGGAIDVNGEGLLLTTEACLLNPNRNPDLGREEIETVLRDYLKVRRIFWLGAGIEGDDTDGHIDELSRFISPTTVVTAMEDDPSDPNYEPLLENCRRLQELTADDGSPLTVMQLPMPSKLIREGIRLPASYANFYIANTVILLPTFADPNDAWAASILQNAFPDRKVVGIDSRDLVWGLGGFHCLTQQQPQVAGAGVG